jgi:cytochrome c-type biogenesis protein CcmH/NrfG
VRQARQAFLEGDLEQATQAYLTLINDQEHLPVVIEDLKEALNRYPADARLWQALGDAYLRADRLDEALEAYDKAEELIR